jgi:hypothetical protein
MGSAFANPVGRHTCVIVFFYHIPQSCESRIELKLSLGAPGGIRGGTVASGLDCDGKYQAGGWLYIVLRDSIRTAWFVQERG